MALARGLNQFFQEREKMKKIIASAVGLMLVGGVAVTTASAVESQFGGYWRTRAFFQDNFTQTDANGNNSSYNRTDNRTRLYYTAKFNDSFKFVNKFEFNSNWGDSNGGDIGADGNTFVVKNSYVDFTLGMVNTKLGIQGAVISRGFIFDDDFSGAVVTGDFGMVKVPVLYISGDQDDVNNNTFVLNSSTGNIEASPGTDYDNHILSIMPSFMIGENFKLTPHVTYSNFTSSETETYWLGLDADMQFDSFSAWATGIYLGGTEDVFTDTESDVNGFLLAAGGDISIVHGQVIYASGDDTPGDDSIDEFRGAPGQSYYWSEIMGLGIFDNTQSAGSPGAQVSNLIAANLGVTIKPFEKMTLDLDAWYASLAEDNINGDDELGWEFDGKLSYALMDDLTADLVFAYLFTGDATGPEDVMEGGVRVSLKF
jgi:hypothetical protein